MSDILFGATLIAIAIVISAFMIAIAIREHIGPYLAEIRDILAKKAKKN